MAGRVPVGSQRTSVAREMENTFIQNLQYAADLLSKVADVPLEWTLWALFSVESAEEPSGGTFRRDPAL